MLCLFNGADGGLVDGYGEAVSSMDAASMNSRPWMWRPCAEAVSSKKTALIEATSKKDALMGAASLETE